jgi:hypothetical protein
MLSIMETVVALNAKETRIIQKLSRPWWPKLTLACVIVFGACGVVLLAISTWDSLRFSRMAEDGLQPKTLSVMCNAWIALIGASTALFSAIWCSVIRNFGLLIRKLVEKIPGS